VRIVILINYIYVTKKNLNSKNDYFYSFIIKYNIYDQQNVIICVRKALIDFNNKICKIQKNNIIFIDHKFTHLHPTNYFSEKKTKHDYA